ncbi:MAG: FAD:protein FMN transferase [Candidatus Eisenbacteria bacterium]
MKKALFIVVMAAVAIAVVFWGRPNGGKPESVQKQTRFLMNTCVTIQVPGDARAVKTIEEAFDRMDEVDRKFNVRSSESPIYHFNHENVPITDPEVLALVETSLELSKESGGAFDITVYPLVDLWGFFRDAPAVPASADIAACVKKVGWQQLRIESGSLTKMNSDVEIDLGAIAKGYAVGEAVKVLKGAGVTSALIDAGGDIYAIGELRGRPWKVGIRNPRGEGVIGVLDVSDLTIVTSGDYERFFEKDGVRYHHILDPASGFPSDGLISVTVICDDAVRGDGLSTALFVLGAERGMELVEHMDGVEAIMVMKDEEILISQGLKGTMETVSAPVAENPFISVGN